MAPRFSDSYPKLIRNGKYVLIASSGQVDEDQRVLGKCRSKPSSFGNRVRGLKRGNNTLSPTQQLKRSKRVVIRCVNICCSPTVVEERMLRPDGGVVQPRRHRMGQRDLTILIL